MAAGTTVNAQQAYAQQNALAAATISQGSIRTIKKIKSGRVDLAMNPGPITVDPPRYGLAVGFIGIFKARIKNTAAAGGAAITLTAAGVANLLEGVTFTDLGSVKRIETNSKHIHFLNSLRNGRPAYSVHSLNDYPIQYGNIIDVIDAPGAIPAGETREVKFSLYIPLTPAPTSFIGAVVLSANNAQAKLDLQFNKNPVAVSGVLGAGSAADAIYQGGTGVIVDADYQVYMEAWEQLPQQNGMPFVPLIDVSTFYYLNKVRRNGMTSGSDFTIEFANARQYMSSIFQVKNGDVARAHGSDIEEIALTSAAFNDFWRYSPDVFAMNHRRYIGTDFPIHTYVQDSSLRPIQTQSFGNVSTVLRFNDVAANAAVDVYYEALGMPQVLAGAQAQASV